MCDGMCSACGGVWRDLRIRACCGQGVRSKLRIIERMDHVKRDARMLRLERQQSTFNIAAAFF